MVRKLKPVIWIYFSCILYWQYIYAFKFSDEADNLAVGWLMGKGYGLYTDVFSHHMPFPYILAALFYLVGFKTYAAFRVAFWIITLSFWIFVYKRFRKHINENILLLAITLHALIVPYYWGNMWLAENFIAYCMAILALYVYNNSELVFGKKDTVIISGCIFVSLTSSLISIYPIFALGVYFLYKKIKNKKGLVLKNELRFLILIATPFVLLFGYYLILGKFNVFIENSYYFNKLYYSKYILDGSPVEIISNWSTEYRKYLLHAFENIFLHAKLDAIQIIEIILVLFNLAFVGYHLYKKNYSIAIFAFFFVSLLRVRGGFFRSSSYNLLSLFHLSMVIYYVTGILLEKRPLQHYYKNGEVQLRNITTSVAKIAAALILFVYAGVFGINAIKVSFGHIGGKPSELHYSTYNEYIQAVTTNKDTIWYAPLDPAVYLANKRKPATRYMFYLPWQAAKDEINTNIISDLQHNRPKIIIFEADASIWEKYKLKDYGSKIYSYIIQNYSPMDKNKDVLKNIYLRNSDLPELQEMLAQKGLLLSQGMEQTNGSSFVGEITKDVFIEQTFKFAKNNIYRIDLSVATFARTNTGEITFILKNDQGVEVYRRSFDTQGLKDNTGLTLEFPPIENAKDKVFTLEVRGTGTKDNAVTLYCSPTDLYSNGTLKINGKEQPGDLSFRIFAK